MLNRLSLLFIAIIGIGVNALAGDWRVLEFPAFDHINGIDMLTPDTGYVVTASGYCFRTFDGGKTWEKFEVIKNIRLESVCFVDVLNGWACGHRGSIYHTSDGGYKWEDQSLENYDIVFFDVRMTSPNNGIAVGMQPLSSNRFNSIAVRTTDGGKNWSPLKPMGLAYSEIRYDAEDEKLFFLAMGKLNISNDGGRHWESYSTIEGNPARTFSILGKTGIMAGPRGVCAYSSDTGKTWINHKLDPEQVFLSSVLLDEQTGYIAGAGGEMMVTTDGGREWVKETLPVKFTIMDMSFVDGYLYAVGSDGIIMVRKIDSE